MDSFNDSSPSAYFPDLVDICQGEDGQLVYAIIKEGELVFADQYVTETETFSIPERKQLRFTLPRAVEVAKYYIQEDDRLYDDVLTYLKRFSALDDEQWVLVAHYVFLTYLHDHPDIDYCPYLLFHAVPERGKSRTGKSVTDIAFRGIHLVELREPIIFRYSERFHGTLFFDLMDLSKKAEKSGCDDILLLRAEKGAMVARVMHPDQGFNDTEYFSIYGPTIIATNEPLHKILDTRCLPIIMPFRPGNYENPRFGLGLELKERLTAWRAKQLFAPLTDLLPIDGISGRLWDISKPLFLVSTILKRQTLLLLGAIRNIACEKNESRQDSPEGRLVAIINELSEENGLSSRDQWSITINNIRAKYNVGRLEKDQVKSQWVGKKLKSMSLHNRHINGYSEIMLTTKEYALLLEQHGLSGGESQLSTNSLPEIPESNQHVLRVVESGRESADGADDDDLPF